MKRPSFQFYPGDWQANSNLRRCTHAEKGVWLDVMCLMHDQPEYGVLRWPLKEIAQAVGAKIGEVRGLVTKGVIKGSDARLDEPNIYIPRSGRKDGEPVTLIAPQAGPIWYSSRMVKDEYVRTIRGEGTRFGDESGEAPKRSPKPPLGDGPSSPSSSPPSGTKEDTPSHSPPVEGVKVEVTDVGRVCKAMKSVGIADVNPGHPTLRTLLEAGATDEEFVGAATKAVAAQRGFAYVLGIVANERKRAAELAEQIHRGAMPATNTTFAQQAADIARTTVPAKPGEDPTLARLKAEAAAAKPMTPEIRQALREAAGRMTL